MTFDSTIIEGLHHGWGGVWGEVCVGGGFWISLISRNIDFLPIRDWIPLNG